ncbi:hypothetical protein NLJ89_g8176 [Agrocybe chaxingu]|uniref:Uncharacterized protein n=1 Tax=Agrocybe chaxingu TaxID=84603 RepID=A0A9W8JVQ1_9AGAR|nr:hypothetical protein NLJ89_g8176 [Agrocybe chaxingu]
MAIISLRLAGMEGSECPVKAAYHHLHPHFLGNVAYIDIEFDFTPGKEIQFFNNLNRAITELENGKLRDFRRFTVIIVDHSDPLSGCLHTMPGNQGSTNISDLFEHLFTPRFRAVLGRHEDNVLLLLACGGVVNVTEARKELATMHLFATIVAFTHTAFVPWFAQEFIANFLQNRFVYKKHTPKAICLEEATQQRWSSQDFTGPILDFVHWVPLFHFNVLLANA